MSRITKIMGMFKKTHREPEVVADSYSPSPDDGVDHINIWNNGETQLGRWLYQSAKTPFIHPEFGYFTTVLGFWQWLVEIEPDDNFRHMFNGQIKDYLKKRGRRPTRFINNKEKIFMAVNFMKIEQNPEIKAAIIDSALPFKEYYYYHKNDGGSIRINQRGHDWVCSMFETIRTMLIEDKKPEPINWAALTSKK